MDQFLVGEPWSHKYNKVSNIIKTVVVIVLFFTFCLTFIIWIVNISKFTGNLAEFSGKLEKAYESQNNLDQKVQYKFKNFSRMIAAKIYNLTKDVNNNLVALKKLLKEVKENSTKGKLI